MSTFVAAVVFAVGVLPATGPAGPVLFVVKPSGVPPFDAGLKYGSLNAFSISPRNSAVKRPGKSNFFEMPRSTRNSDGPLTVMLRDATSGEETYGAGRYLSVPAPDATGATVIDFNFAYTPPCGFTDHATCPLPPPENELPVAIRAGERDPH